MTVDDELAQLEHMREMARSGPKAPRARKPQSHDTIAAKKAAAAQRREVNKARKAAGLGPYGEIEKAERRMRRAARRAAPSVPTQSASRPRAQVSAGMGRPPTIPARARRPVYTRGTQARRVRLASSMKRIRKMRADDLAAMKSGKILPAMYYAVWGHGDGAIRRAAEFEVRNGELLDVRGFLRGTV